MAVHQGPAYRNYLKRHGFRLLVISISFLETHLGELIVPWSKEDELTERQHTGKSGTVRILSLNLEVSL